MTDHSTATARPAAAVRAIALAAGLTLALGACSTFDAFGDADPLDFGTRLSADLTGAAEVPQTGDPDGSGEFVAALSADGRMCYELEAQDVDLITAAHIHEGTAGNAGPVVAPLITPQPGQRANGCTTIASDLARRILSAPENFYVNTHNTQYPAGAVRGQLGRGE